MLNVNRSKREAKPQFLTDSLRTQESSLQEVKDSIEKRNAGRQGTLNTIMMRLNWEQKQGDIAKMNQDLGS